MCLLEDCWESGSALQSEPACWSGHSAGWLGWESRPATPSSLCSHYLRIRDTRTQLCAKLHNQPQHRVPRQLHMHSIPRRTFQAHHKRLGRKMLDHHYYKPHKAHTYSNNAMYSLLQYSLVNKPRLNYRQHPLSLARIVITPLIRLFLLILIKFF